MEAVKAGEAFVDVEEILEAVAVSGSLIDLPVSVMLPEFRPLEVYKPEPPVSEWAAELEPVTESAVELAPELELVQVDLDLPPAPELPALPADLSGWTDSGSFETGWEEPAAAVETPVAEWPAFETIRGHRRHRGRRRHSGRRRSIRT